jgi:hypothetical protein
MIGLLYLHQRVESPRLQLDILRTLALIDGHHSGLWRSPHDINRRGLIGVDEKCCELELWGRNVLALSSDQLISPAMQDLAPPCLRIGRENNKLQRVTGTSC